MQNKKLTYTDFVNDIAQTIKRNITKGAGVWVDNFVSSPNSRGGRLVFRKYPEVDFDFLESNWPRTA